MAACLQDICRLYGGDGAAGVDKRQPHSKEKYREIILRALDVDVSQDDSTVHPRHICHSCLKKLQKWWSAAKLRKKKELNIRLVSFSQHRCSRCSTVEENNGFSSFCERVGAVLVDYPSFFKWKGSGMLKIIYLGNSGCSEVEIFIDSNLAMKIDVCGVNIKESGCQVLQNLPPTADVASVKATIEALQMLNICSGNRDFDDLVRSREGPAGQIPVTVTGGDWVQRHPFPTVRHRRCQLLIARPAVQCEVCVIFKVDLKVLASRVTVGMSREVSASSSIRNDALSLMPSCKLRSGF